MKLKKIFAALTFLPLVLVPLTSTAAETYPGRPVVVIAPSGPGGGYDFVGRLMSQVLGEQIKGSFVVENRPGSGTVVGTRAAATAAPDGYTLMVGGV
ncbi:MAG: tripartite tricarboxylate transporter substrate-binding protein, partial [Pseudomonadota bacterium]